MRSATFASALAILGALVLAVPAEAGRNYKGYGSCNVFEKRPDKDKRCFQGNPWGAVFIARKRAGVKYRLCVRDPTGDKDCFNKRTKKAGKPSSIGFFGPSSPHHVGKYRFTWKVGGKFATRTEFRLKPEFSSRQPAARR